MLDKYFDIANSVRNIINYKKIKSEKIKFKERKDKIIKSKNKKDKIALLITLLLFLILFSPALNSNLLLNLFSMVIILYVSLRIIIFLDTEAEIKNFYNNIKKEKYSKIEKKDLSKIKDLTENVINENIMKLNKIFPFIKDKKDFFLLKASNKNIKKQLKKENINIDIIGKENFLCLVKKEFETLRKKRDDLYDLTCKENRTSDDIGDFDTSNIKNWELKNMDRL